MTKYLMSLASNIMTQVILHVTWTVCPCLFGCHQVAVTWITIVNVLPKCPASYCNEMCSARWFIQQCGKFCYLEVYRDPLYFTVPSTGSTLCLSW